MLHAGVVGGRGVGRWVTRVEKHVCTPPWEETLGHGGCMAVGSVWECECGRQYRYDTFAFIPLPFPEAEALDSSDPAEPRHSKNPDTRSKDSGSGRAPASSPDHSSGTHES